MNYRLPDVLCALGISQLKQLDQFRTRRNEIFSLYTSQLQGFSGIELPKAAINVSPNWHFYPILVNPEIRAGLYKYLHKNGIAVQVNYIPAYRHPAFGLDPKDFLKYPNSELYYSRELSLPIHFGITDEQAIFIANCIKKYLSINK